MKLTDKDKRAIYECVMSYFKDEVTKRLNEAYAEDLRYYFNNKKIKCFDMIAFDENGKADFVKLYNNCLGSITSDESFILATNKTYKYSEVFDWIKTHANRVFHASLMHIVSLIAKTWNLNIPDYIWNDYLYGQILRLNKETFKTKVSNVVKNKNGNVVDFDFVIENMDLRTDITSREYYNILCGDAEHPEHLYAIVYISVDLCNKLSKMRRERKNNAAYKDPLEIASIDRYARAHKYGKGFGTYDQSFKYLEGMVRYGETNVRSHAQYDYGKYWDSYTVKEMLKNEINGKYNKDKYTPVFFRWLKKNHEEFYNRLMRYLNLE